MQSRTGFACGHYSGLLHIKKSSAQDNPSRKEKRAEVLRALKCGFKINMKLIWEAM